MEFTHASFPEYLLDRSRSKEFLLDIRKVHCTLARHWFRIYSTRFKLYPHGGLLLTSIASYRLGNDTYLNDLILFDVISHCVEAEWISELRQDICTFNVEAAFTLSTDDLVHSGAHIPWNGIVRWLDFIFWIEHSHLLPATETEPILDRIDNLIESGLSKLSIGAPLRRLAATLLTLRNLINVKGFWHNVRPDFGPLSDWYSVSELYNYRPYSFHHHIHDMSSLWLCKTLAMDAEMNGAFFSDGTLYTNVALLYARAAKHGCVDRSCVENLPVVLSRSAPCEELVTLLTWLCLQVHSRSFDDVDKSDVECFFISIIIYLFECGVPFLSEHQHGPGFHPDSWHCGICILLDPSKAEYADIEISMEPAVKPLPEPAQRGAEAPEPLQIHQIWNDIPGFPLIWLRTWIFWLADIMTRFFPVVA
ncbi:hypothetical protein D9619_013689 [Psilocybe cf. subviscida]|uniref:Uncharacterized protein n=1 Tax=Psilocybe cf. subviscida TaxID=2480587 RepID=A0A8H5B0K6_9AGAR|nr:hypothetical protein D9619_013689 [Psilocybe cf. subviscida]